MNLSKLMDDYRLWRCVINGYPYKTPAEMGVDNEYDAYLATKQAIYCILYGNNVDTYYRGGNDRGVRVHNAMKHMVYEGLYGTYTPNTNNVTASKVGSLKAEGNYYSQEYSVTSRVEMSQYTITSTSNMPSGAYIANTSGVATTTFASGNNFKIMIPKSQISKDINIAIGIQSRCKNYSVFYRKSQFVRSSRLYGKYRPIW